ncbi:MAG: hypothetical protein ABFS42_13435 [Candidatus Krumholzibacteriota bacterium]
MNKRNSWERFEAVGVALVVLHSLVLGVMLIFLPGWTLEFAGFDGPDDYFFPRQSGAFHIVVALGYALEYRRSRGITLILLAKFTAVVFLLLLSPWDKAWSVPFSGIADGLMLVGMTLLHGQASRRRMEKL